MIVALGAIYIFVGVITLIVAIARRRIGVRMLVWAGLFVGLFGTRMLLAANVTATALINYVILLPALLFWAELSAQPLRAILLATISISAALSIVGIAILLGGGSPTAVLPYFRALTLITLIGLAVISAVPALARRLLIIQSPVLGAGMVLTAIAVAYVAASGQRGAPIESVAFAAFVFSLLYVAGEKLFRDERRLLSIDNELAIARGIQRSILPASVPDVKGLRIDVAYDPMTAVGGDFYEFIPLGERSIGILIADVTGHGVPAALIASMLKIAIQSAIGDAREPARFLRALNRILTRQLRGQLVSAAYVFIDDNNARYSAAGHPPLALWRRDAAQLQRIDSNGLLFGVNDDAAYPEKSVTLASGDRLILYTDGLVERENRDGEEFGLQRVEEIIRRNPSLTSHDLSSAVGKWMNARQDDTTIVIVDYA